jgi:O-antigen ligase
VLGGLTLRRVGRRPLWALVVIVPAVLGVLVPTHHSLVALAVLPALLLLAGALAGPSRWTVVLIALGAGMVGKPFTSKMAFGGSGIWLSDLLIAGAIAGFAVEWLLKPSHLRPRLPRTALMGIPVLLFGLAIMVGAFRGHERYGATLFGMPLRLVFYSAILFALPGLTPSKALRGLTFVMYGGALWLAGVASYHIATGTSATSHLDLSTGGIRYIGIAAATYAAAAFVLAILNLSAGRPRPLLHLAMALVAGFDVIVAYTRTIWLALTVIVIVAMLFSPQVRSALVASIPLAAPLLLLGVLLVLLAAPNLVSTLSERVSTPAGEDTSVQWRQKAYQAVLSGTSDEPVLGIGFGRTTSFTINSMPNTITGDPHNGFIYVFAGAGALGVASLILLLLTFLAGTARRWRDARGDARTLVSWCFCTWLLVVVHAASEPVFTTPSLIIVLWIAMVLPSIVPLKPRRRVAVPMPEGTRPQPARSLALVG